MYDTEAMNASERATRIKGLAAEHGFALQGIAAVPADGAAPHADFLARWLAGGRNGPLTYLADSAEARGNLHRRFPWARSVLSVGSFYDGAARGTRGEDFIAHVARYARGRDYHVVFEKRLKKLAVKIMETGLSVDAHYYVDTGPVLERNWAQRAGLGWVGKNTLLIHPRQGSYLLLGEIILAAELPADEAVADHCGSCTACLDACPTGAFTASRELDARRCIVTWNLEEKGAVPQERWAEHHGWAAGCDICQEVCPFNRDDWRPPPDAGLDKARGWEGLSLAEAIAMSEATFDAAFRASALRRTGWKGLRLGAITAAGNVKAAATRAALRGCLEDADEDIRARAAWALAQLDG